MIAFGGFVNLIVAVDRKWGIGRDGGLLASLPTDMKYFRKMTSGKVVVMGRKTLESMPGRKGLPNRTNYVLTSNPSYEADGCIIVNTPEELWTELAKHDTDDVFLIGGAAIYNAFYKLCDRLYITKIDADLCADTFIVNMAEDTDFELETESEPVDENGLSFRFTVYKNVSRT